MAAELVPKDKSLDLRGFSRRDYCLDIFLPGEARLPPFNSGKQTMVETSERIGVVGLGRMGSAIATALLSKGFPVSGWNRSPVVDATPFPVVPDLAALVAASDILILSLFDDAAVSDVIRSLLDQTISGRLIVDTSTVRPDTLAAFADPLKTAGATALDAPISGGPAMVITATAGLFVGGSVADLARFQPAARSIAARVRHIGPLGSGAAAKIVNNMMLLGHWESLREAMLVGRRAGLSARTIVEIVADGPAGTAALRGRMAEVLGETDRVGFSVVGGLKDASLFLDVAESYGVDVPAMSAGHAAFAALVDQGFADDDLAAVIREAGYST
jgi:3-hydroxyisobutyrate dehydrogenase